MEEETQCRLMLEEIVAYREIIRRDGIKARKTPPAAAAPTKTSKWPYGEDFAGYVAELEAWDTGLP